MIFKNMRTNIVLEFILYPGRKERIKIKVEIKRLEKH